MRQLWTLIGSRERTAQVIPLLSLEGRVFVLKQRFLLESTQPLDGGKGDSHGSIVETAAALQGCLWALRNLAHLFPKIPLPASTEAGERKPSDGECFAGAW